MKTRRGIILAGLLIMGLAGLVLIGPRPGRTITVVALGLSEMIDQSDLVVLARVESTECGYGEGLTGSMIFTYLRLKVTDKIKGQGPDEFWIGIPGGTIGDKSINVPGMPHPAIGEQALWFLEKTGQVRQAKPVCRIIGVDQGYASLMQDPKSGRQMVMIGLTHAKPGPAPETRKTKVQLSDLVALIKAHQANHQASKQAQEVKP